MMRVAGGMLLVAGTERAVVAGAVAIHTPETGDGTLVRVGGKAPRARLRIYERIVKRAVKELHGARDDGRMRLLCALFCDARAFGERRVGCAESEISARSTEHRPEHALCVGSEPWKYLPKPFGYRMREERILGAGKEH